jgi:hypothetical protein
MLAMCLFCGGGVISGAGRTKWLREDGWEEMYGSSKGRLLGVTKTVTVRPRVSNSRVRSRRGIMWPAVG